MRSIMKDWMMPQRQTLRILGIMVSSLKTPRSAPAGPHQKENEVGIFFKSFFYRVEGAVGIASWLKQCLLAKMFTKVLITND